MEIGERVAVLEVEVANVKDTTKMIHEININMAIMLNEMKDIREDNKQATEEIKNDMKGVKNDISTVKGEIENVKQTPIKDKAKKIDKIEWLILSGLITFTLTYFLNIIIK